MSQLSRHSGGPCRAPGLAYFSNYVLIAALLGLGLGMMLAAGLASRPSVFFAVALAGMVRRPSWCCEARDFVVPLVAEGQFVWNYSRRDPPVGTGRLRVLLGSSWRSAAVAWRSTPTEHQLVAPAPTG